MRMSIFPYFRYFFLILAENVSVLTGITLSAARSNRYSLALTSAKIRVTGLSPTFAPDASSESEPLTWVMAR